jgi:S1-C subfamily serine protease
LRTSIAGSFRTNHLSKTLYTGKIKKQESLFLYFLSLLGCDILYINSETDIPLDYQTVIDNSRLKQSGELRVCNLPIPDYQAAVSVSVALPTETKATVLVAEPLQIIQPSRNPLSIISNRQKDNRDNPGRELSFEEIAALSEAIVMIKVIDESGEYFKTGSGVVISPDGYILTNCHVVSGGEGFAVKFENDSKEYFTRSLVKYHTDYDLAVIRVDRTCQILPVLAQGSLVRGQRIAAIGSPLGLFNTISDGIISGFRELELKSMIQFTAPISHGSSGGALIDLYGRLVGIITAGFDDGQNLNLAVDYTTINTFANNFIRR